MIIYKNLVILGTSHISIESVNEVESVIRSISPDVVALELDSKRFNALFSKKIRISILDIKSIGVKGFLFNLIGAFVEKKLGKLVGVSPGSEMKKATLVAKELKCKIALIDQDINITLNNISKRLTFKEKMNFFVK